MTFFSYCSKYYNFGLWVQVSVVMVIKALIYCGVLVTQETVV